MTTRQKFRQTVKGKNFMTPDILKYGNKRGGEIPWELSSREGFTGNKIYGVTVVKNGKHDHDLSDCFQIERKATAHIERL